MVINQESFLIYIKMYREFDHPNIVNLDVEFEDDKNIFLVMEDCQGDEMFNRIIEKG